MTDPLTWLIIATLAIIAVTLGGWCTTISRRLDKADDRDMVNSISIDLIRQDLNRIETRQGQHTRRLCRLRPETPDEGDQE